MRNSFGLFLFLLLPLATVLIARQQPSQLPAPPPQAEAPQPSPPQQETQTPPPAPPAQPAYTGPVIVLDPAHGGTDPGARGPSGPAEKDVVLQFARATRVELVRQGYRVVLTRDDDSNPSYDDRAAIANSYHDAILITFHVSSTGTVGTARAYFYQFWSRFPHQSQAPSADTGQAASTSAQPPASPLAISSPTLVPWNEAQRPYADASHRLADQLQLQFTQQFQGSPSASRGVAIRGLRSVAAPAVAVEISSVAAPNGNALTSMAAPLAGSIARAIQSFRPANTAGAK